MLELDGRSEAGDDPDVLPIDMLERDSGDVTSSSSIWDFGSAGEYLQQQYHFKSILLGIRKP